MSNVTGTKPVEDVFRRERVGSLCRTAPATALRTTSTLEVVRRLRGDSGGCVIVVDAQGRPEGIFTERDYLDKLALDPDGVRLEATPIEKHMTPQPRTLKESESLGAAIQLLTSGGYRHLPLVDDRGQLKGTLSVRDIIVYLAGFFPAEVMNLPPSLSQPIGSREGG